MKKVSNISKQGFPLTKELLTRLIISNFFKKVPALIIQEFMGWDEVYKSPYSNSFYSKRKTWDHTHHETIRFSDHWNFQTHGNTHCKTDLPINQNTWAKGIYDETLEVFKIVQLYPAVSLPYNEFRQKIIAERKEYYATSEEATKVKAFGKHLHDQIDQGTVKIFTSEYKEGVVIQQWKMHSTPAFIKILNPENGESLKLDKKLCKRFLEYKEPFKVSIADEIINGEDLINNLTLKYQYNEQ